MGVSLFKHEVEGTVIPSDKYCTVQYSTVQYNTIHLSILQRIKLRRIADNKFTVVGLMDTLYHSPYDRVPINHRQQTALADCLILLYFLWN